MRIAIFSDVHGNLPALEVFVAATVDEVDAYVCLGDIVNYGPWNDECLELVQSLPGIVVLEGNHERLFRGVEPIEDEVPLVREFFRNSRAHFTHERLIRDLPATHTLGRYTCRHTLDGDKRIYPDTQVDVSHSWVIGHTHHQFRTRCGEHEVVNCGSVGQNRGFIDIVNYVIFDETSQVLALEARPYRVDLLLDEMVARGYPGACLDYYRRKPRAHA